MLHNCLRKKKQQSKFVFSPPAGTFTLPNPKKNRLNGDHINRLTEQKTGEDVNKNKLVTEKAERRTESGVKKERKRQFYKRDKKNKTEK